MGRFARIVLYFLLFIVALIGVGVGAFFLTPSSTLASMARTQVEQATGRTLVIEGDIERRLFPILGVGLGRVSLSNADWAEEPQMIEADEVVVGVKLVALFTGGIDIEELRLVKPVIRLEVDPSGRANWEFEGDAGGDAGGDQGSGDDGEPFSLSIASAEIVDGVFAYDDRVSGQRIELDDLEVALTLPDLDKPLELQGSALWNGRTATLKGAVDSLARIQAGERFTSDLRFDADGVALAFEGDAQSPNGDGAPLAAGDFSFSLSGDKAETAWLRQSFPPSLAPLGAVDVSGRLDASEAGLKLDVQGAADFNDVGSELSLSAESGAGWADGAGDVELDFSVKNALMQAGYAGRVGETADGAPLAKGRFQLSVPDMGRLLAWTGQPTPAPTDPIGRLSRIDLAGDLDIDGQALKANAAGEIDYNGRTVSLDANMDGGDDWRSGGAVRTAFGANANRFFDGAWSGTLGFDGDELAALDGQLIFETQRLREFAQWAGAGPIEAPDGTFESLSAFLTASYAADDAATLQIDNLMIGSTRAAGAVTAALDAERPTLDIKLTTGPLDIRPFESAGDAGGGGSAGGGSGGASGGGWSDEPIDFSPLRLVDAVFDIEIESLKSRQITLGRSKLTGTLENGLLNANLEELGIYGGGATAVLQIDAQPSTTPPTVALNTTFDALQMRPLLTEVAAFESFEGLGSLSLDITGEGASLNQLMNSWDGEGRLDVVDGAIYGVNLAALMRNIGSAFLDANASVPQRTDFASMDGSFTIADGVITNQDFRLLGPLVRLDGAGLISLGGQSLNYRVKPRAVASILGQGGVADLGGPAFPILITGPWSSPSISLDLESGVEGLIESPEAMLQGLQGLDNVDLERFNLGDLTPGIVDGALPDGVPTGVVDDVVDGVLNDALGGGSEGGSEGGGAPSPERVIEGLFGN